MKEEKDAEKKLYFYKQEDRVSLLLCRKSRERKFRIIEYSNSISTRSRTHTILKRSQSFSPFFHTHQKNFGAIAPVTMAPIKAKPLGALQKGS